MTKEQKQREMDLSQKVKAAQFEVSRRCQSVRGLQENEQKMKTEQDKHLVRSLIQMSKGQKHLHQQLARARISLEQVPSFYCSLFLIIIQIYSSFSTRISTTLFIFCSAMLLNYIDN